MGTVFKMMYVPKFGHKHWSYDCDVLCFVLLSSNESMHIFVFFVFLIGCMARWESPVGIMSAYTTFFTFEMTNGRPTFKFKRLNHLIP